MSDGRFMDKPILYSYFRSSSAYRVRIALHYKHIPFEYRAVHLIENGGEQHREAYKKLNPSEQIPCLVHHSRSIGQSVAIIEYLEEVEPTPPLFPSAPWEKAHVRQICEIFNSGIQPLHNLSLFQHLEKNFGLKTQEQKDAWAAHWIHEGFRGVEEILTQTAGACCMGDRVSAADLFLVPAVFAAERFKCTLEKYPTMKRINDHLVTLEAFKKAHPFNQPDTPAEFKK